MSYISLYRKYRSQTFDDVVGQDHVVRTIRNAITAGRIAQGYLFCGSRGTGKTTVARLIAKALNCEHGPTPDPCNSCEACLSITDASAVDVIEMDAASNRSVDDVDSLRDGVKYPPMRLRYKVYIIDEAHQLSAQAKDAFLKTLEEPPAHAVFILATTEAQKIPLTIRSRCQQFDFRRGTAGEIGDRLRHVVSGENAAIDPDAADLIARAANGSYRDALSLLEQVMAYTEGTVTTQDVTTVLGMVDEEVLLELGDVLGSRDTAAAFAMADRLMREGRDVRELLKSLANHFRDLLALKVGADTRRRDDERWRTQAEVFSQDRLVRIIDEFSAAEKDLRWNDQHRLGLEMALLKAMVRERQPEAPPVADVAASAPVKRAPEPDAPAVRERAPEPPRKKAAPEPVDVPVKTAEPVEAANVADAAFKAQPAAEEPVEDVPARTAPEPEGEGVSLADVRRNWERTLRHLQKGLRQPNVYAVAREGHPVDLTDSVLKVGYPKKYDFHRQRLEHDSGWLEKALEDVLKVKLRIVAAVVDDLSSSASARSTARRSEAEPKQHPLLSEVQEKFGGNVVDGKDYPWEE